MVRSILLHSCVWALATASIAQPDQTPAEQYAAVLRDYQKLEAKYEKLLLDAKTDEEKTKIKATRPDPAPFARRMLAIAQKYPKDAVAFDTLLWVVDTTPSAADELDRALVLLADNHFADTRISKVFPTLARNASGQKLLRLWLEKSADLDVRGLACYYLAVNLKNQAELGRFEKKSDAAKGEREAEALFERVLKEYPNVKDRDRTLRERAEPQLFELRFLAVGKTVPEIEAEDIDGKLFKLSDYRGKVVLLEFWGHW